MVMYWVKLKNVSDSWNKRCRKKQVSFIAIYASSAVCRCLSQSFRSWTWYVKCETQRSWSMWMYWLSSWFRCCMIKEMYSADCWMCRIPLWVSARWFTRGSLRCSLSSVNAADLFKSRWCKWNHAAAQSSDPIFSSSLASAWPQLSPSCRSAVY